MRGLHDEAEGITFENVLSPLEQAERFVQWAEAGAGSRGNGLPWSDRSGDVRYNLGQFWSLKGQAYGEDPAAWDRLDLRAHKAWAALAELGMIADNPPAQARYQQEAQQAYAGAIAIAGRLNQSTAALLQNAGRSSEFYGQAQRGGIDDTMTAAVRDRVNELVDEASQLLGIPTWAWAVGGVGLAYLLWVRR